MPAEVKLTPVRATFEARCRHAAVCPRRGPSLKHLPLALLLIVVLFVVCVRLVASDTGPLVVETARAPLSYVAEAHVAYYEAHLARMALESANCR